MTLSQKLGDRIKHYRKLQRLTQEQLAEKADLSLNFIGLIEIGRSTPSLKSLARIANALNTPLHALLKFPDTNTSLQVLKLKASKALNQLTLNQLEYLCSLLDLLQSNTPKKHL